MSPALQLTFDDGPDPVWTPRVLDVLRAAALQATFFVMGARAAEYGALVRRAQADGHAVELHCHEHVRHTELDPAAGRADTQQALRVLTDLGVHAARWRTPWGVHAPWTAGVAAEHGLQLCGWDHDTHDWRGDRAEAMLAAVGPGLAGGGLVLLHDGVGPGARRDGCAETVRFVELLAAEAVAA